MKDYAHYLGKDVLVNRICGFVGDDSVDIELSPAAKVRAEATNEQSLKRWIDGWCDPLYEVALVEDHPQLNGVRSLWIHGPSLHLNGKQTEASDIVEIAEPQSGNLRGNVKRSSFKGTRAPDADGVYALSDGRFSRFFGGQWRAPNSDIAKAGNETRLDAFPSPQFRIKDHHRWSVVEGNVNKAVDPDYWYYNRHHLKSGQVFHLHDGTIVMLDRRVPGDGTKWSVYDWDNGWSCYDNEIEPGDLRGEPITDSKYAIRQATEVKNDSPSP